MAGMIAAPAWASSAIALTACPEPRRSRRPVGGGPVGATGGLAKVRPQWWLMCTVLNLRKLYGFWLAGRFGWPGACGGPAAATG